MAINRFDSFPNYNFDFQIYQDKQFVPDLSFVKDILVGLQNQYDTGISIIEQKRPKYLQKDEPVFEELSKRYSDLQKEIEDAYASGNVRLGQRKLKDALKQIQQDMQPGGDYYNLEKRYEGFQNLLKNYKPILDKAPSYYKSLVLDKIYSSIPDYKDEATGLVNTEIRDPGYGEWIDINKDLFEALKNVQSDKGTIVYTKNGYIWSKTNERVTRDELKNIALGLLRQPKYSSQISLESEILARNLDEQTSKEYIVNKIEQTLPENTKARKEALKELGFYTGAINDVEDDVLKEAEKKYIESTLNELGENAVKPENVAVVMLQDLYMEPAVKTFEQNKETIDLKADPYALEEIRHKYRLKEDEIKRQKDKEEQFTTLTSRLTGNPNGMPDWKLDFVKGKVGIPVEKQRTQMSGTGFTTHVTTKTEIEYTKSFKEALQNGELEKSQPGINFIYNEFASQIQKMTDEQAFEFVKNRYNELREKTSVTDIEYIVPANEKIFDSKNKLLIGNKGAIGNIANTSIFVFDPANGIQSGAMTIEDVLKTYGITPEQFTKNATWAGSTTSTNPFFPAGELVILSTPDGRVVTLLSSGISREKSKAKEAGFILYSSLTSLSGESPVVHIPELSNYAKNGIKAKRNLITISDALTMQHEDFVKSLNEATDEATKNAMKEKIAEIEKTLSQLKPQDDKILDVQIDLYDPITNTKIGTHQDFLGILQMLEKKAE